MVPGLLVLVSDPAQEEGPLGGQGKRGGVSSMVKGYPDGALKGRGVWGQVLGSSSSLFVCLFFYKPLCREGAALLCTRP